MHLFNDDSELPHLIGGFLAELLGSFVLVFGTAGAAAIQYAVPAIAPDPTISAFSQGLSYMAALWLAAPISGGHINPLVSLMLWMHGGIEWLLMRYQESTGIHVLPSGYMRRFKWYHALLWILGQFVGAIIAGALLLAVFGRESTLGRPVVGAFFGFTDTMAFVYEIIGSSVLFFVILTAMMHPAIRPWFVPVIGLTQLFLTMVGLLISGAAFNWWIHFGPTVIANAWDGSTMILCPLGETCPPTSIASNDGFDGSNVDWIWYVGPFIGVFIALFLFWVIYYFLGQSPAYRRSVKEDSSRRSHSRRRHRNSERASLQDQGMLKKQRAMAVLQQAMNMAVGDSSSSPSAVVDMFDASGPGSGSGVRRETN